MYTPMIQQYLSIKAQATDAFLFFRLGDFYELFFEDAILASEELEITLTKRDGGKEPIPMCGVPHHSATTYIQRLIHKGYKVAICEQVENSSGKSGMMKREIVRVITPGTLIDEGMLQDQENNFLVGLASKENAFALSAVDLSTGEIYVTYVEDSFDLLLNELSSYQPKEVVYGDGLDPGLLKVLPFRTRAVLTPVSVSLEERELYSELQQQFPQFDDTCTLLITRQVVGLLYLYLKQTQKRALTHLKRLRFYDVTQHMVLDDFSRRNLELTVSLEGGKRKGSLLWLLDCTKTAMGSRLLKKWLDKPLLNLRQIHQRQEIVQALLTNFELLDDVKEYLKGVHDLERLGARVAYGTANARDLVSLKRSLVKIPSLKNTLLQSSCNSIARLGQELDPCDDIADFIDKAIVEEAPVSLKEGNIIKQGYDLKLDELKEIQANGKSWIARLEQKEREETGIKTLKIGYNRVFGYYIEVTRANLRLLPQDRYIRKQTLSNAERFITPELKEQEERILTASEKSIEIEYQLFTQVRNQVGEQIGRIQRLSELVAGIDVLCAFASLARENGYVRPTVHNESHLYIRAGRHPVVEVIRREKEFISNDIELNGEDRQVLLITGPNMAGKSTYMRQVALITILSQIGSFVPATEATIPVVDRIFTRIGAADDLVGGRSTFMVEMEETCRALREATSNSLILLDEIGRGTSTYDGIALAHAIVEYIHNEIGAKTLFSTHYHELTELEDKLPRLMNIHAKCVEQGGRVLFLHRMIPGKADRSYGIYVAELAGLPKVVIERAKELLCQLEQEVAPAYQQSAVAMDIEEESEWITRLRSFDLMSHTPMECMRFLEEIQSELK